MKIDRLVGIIMMLLHKRKVTAKEMADRFEVSVRTIQRDMDHLNMAGIPIYSDVGIKGGYSLVEDYMIEKNFLNMDEANILKAFLDSIEKTVPYNEAKSVAGKFMTMLPTDESDEKLVVDFNPLVGNAHYKKVIERLTKARDEHLKVNISYINADLYATTRSLEPYTLVMMGNSWYVYGFCCNKEDFRMFKVSRITDIDLTQERYEPRKLPDEKPWNHQLDSNRESTGITLALDLCMKGRIPDYFDPEKCRIEGDKILVEFDFPVDEWVYQLIMGLVPYVKVIEPDWVREALIDRLNKGIANI